MKPIFSRGPSLQIRLILAVLVALGIIIADSRLGTFSQIRTYMDTAVSPFYFVSNAPRELLDGVSQTLASRDQLELENRALRQELLLKNSELLMLGQYKQENARLRELLGSPLRQDEQKMVTQVIPRLTILIAIKLLSIKVALMAFMKASRSSATKVLLVRWWPSLN